jgi:hypothetical protein
MTQLDMLDAIAADRIHATDRQRVEDAIRADAQAHSGCVDSNRVRESLRDRYGLLTVYPRSLSATYSALRQAGVIRRDGWTTSTDTHGRNAGKPARTYRWVG